MKKFTHIAIVALLALFVTACANEYDRESDVYEVYQAEILTPTCEISLTTDEINVLIEEGTFTDLSTTKDYVWLTVDAEEYDFDVTGVTGYRIEDGYRLYETGSTLSLLCEVVRYEVEDAAGYVDNTITPVSYHFYPDTDELYTYKSTDLTQERFETYQKKDASGNYPEEFVDDEITDFITGLSYDHLRLDRYFMKDGVEFHIMLYSQVFDEEYTSAGEVMYSMSDPNGIIIIRRVGADGVDEFDKLLYSPSNEITYTMERSYLDPTFDYSNYKY